MEYLKYLNKCLTHAYLSGLNNKTLSAKAGIHHQTLTNWTTRVSCPSVVDYTAVINACGFAVPWDLTAEPVAL